MAGVIGMVLAITACPYFSAAQTEPSVNADGRRNIPPTGVPFLRISPDARSGGMGETGIAIAPDANAVFWNMSKIPFAEQKTQVSASYTPWLRDIIGDMYLANVAAYHQLDDKQAIGGSLRYFSLGSMQFSTAAGNEMGSVRARELALDAGYARKLSDNWSMGAAMRYIYSNLGNAQSAEGQGKLYKPAHAVAGDLSFSYHKALQQKNNQEGGALDLGVVLSNIGTKISYASEGDKLFLPANIGIGAAYTHAADEKNKITFAVDFNKLMVPGITEEGKYTSGQSPIDAAFKSFNDAPGGFKEELKEVTYSLGAEYWYNNQFALRAGYFHESAQKGDRQYFTAGAGIKLNAAGFNFSYIVPSGSGTARSPLSNTLRFSLLVDLGKE